jgi:hypothetical protein
VRRAAGGRGHGADDVGTRDGVRCGGAGGGQRARDGAPS